jgi:hypothetical protein
MKIDMRRILISILLICLILLTSCTLPSTENNGDANQNNQANSQNQENQDDNIDKSRGGNDDEANQNNNAAQGANASNDDINEEEEAGEGNNVAPDVAPHAPLSDTGPWYIVSNPEGLYAFNMDGSGLTLVTRGDPDNFGYLSEGVSSSGGRFAYITGENTYNNLVLHIIDMSNNLEHNTIELLSDEDVDIQAKRAIVEFPSFVWSHSGDQLAFFGVLDGPSSDLYVYSASDQSITRLTSGPSQGYQPSWSPDDKYILHTGADTFGTGAGYSMSGVWAAAADDSGVIDLPLPGGSSDEIILGWRDNDTFLSYSWNPVYGYFNLRFTNLHVGLAEEVWEHPFSAVGFSNADQPWVLLGINEYQAEENPAGLSGIFILVAPDYQPQQLFEDTHGYFQSTGTGLFIVDVGDNSYIIGPTTMQDISYSNEKAVFSEQGSPAWYSKNGLWVMSGGENIQVTDMPVELAAWGANSASILFSTDGHLHVATAPDWKPVLVAAIFYPEEIILVNP